MSTIKVINVIHPTGTTNNLVLDNAANVAVGTSINQVYDNVAAARPLVVQSSSTATTGGNSTNSITIANSDTTTNNLSQLNFAAITGANQYQFSAAWIACQYGARTNGQYPTGQLIFATSTATNSAPSEKMRLSNTGGFSVGTTTDPGAGKISDSIGEVRSVPVNTQTGAYVAVSTDAGKYINITTGGVTINASTGFTSGQSVSIYNNSGSSQTITATGITLYQAGTANTGNRTLAQRGLCTVLCVASNTYVITGAGVS
jgi:hypothetical protein